MPSRSMRDQMRPAQGPSAASPGAPMASSASGINPAHQQQSLLNRKIAHSKRHAKPFPATPVSGAPGTPGAAQPPVGMGAPAGGAGMPNPLGSSGVAPAVPGFGPAPGATGGIPGRTPVGG